MQHVGIQFKHLYNYFQTKTLTTSMLQAKQHARAWQQYANVNLQKCWTP